MKYKKKINYFKSKFQTINEIADKTNTKFRIVPVPDYTHSVTEDSMSEEPKTLTVDKPVTVEEAAHKLYPDNGRAVVTSTLGRKAFKQGAEWQKEQLAIDAIEFMQFRDDHCTKMGERWMTLFAGDGGKLYTIKELYELWKQIN